jgi:hypothetical protein
MIMLMIIWRREREGRGREGKSETTCDEAYAAGVEMMVVNPPGLTHAHALG